MGGSSRAHAPPLQAPSGGLARPRRLACAVSHKGPEVLVMRGSAPTRQSVACLLSPKPWSSVDTEYRLRPIQRLQATGRCRFEAPRRRAVIDPVRTHPGSTSPILVRQLGLGRLDLGIDDPSVDRLLLFRVRNQSAIDQLR